MATITTQNDDDHMKTMSSSCSSFFVLLSLCVYVIINHHTAVFVCFLCSFVANLSNCTLSQQVMMMIMMMAKKKGKQNICLISFALFLALVIRCYARTLCLFSIYMYAFLSLSLSFCLSLSLSLSNFLLYVCMFVLVFFCSNSSSGEKRDMMIVKMIIWYISNSTCGTAFSKTKKKSRLLSFSFFVCLTLYFSRRNEIQFCK